MRALLVASLLLVSLATPADAQVSVGVGIALPGIQIGVNVPAYPELELVPGYPVYYDPRADSNYFFYDGVYWVYQGDNWYASSWYNGPWRIVPPERVPLYVLRVPVRYYRRPPPYFGGWRPDGPPRWGERWGRGWERQHRGWDRWDRGRVPQPAPLPAYQRQYAGDRYPHEWERQREIRSDAYRYRPRESFAREHFEQRGGPPRQGEMRGPGPQPRPQGEMRGPGPQPPHDRGRGHGDDRRDDRREGGDGRDHDRGRR